MTTQIPINSNSNIDADDLTISQCISLINNKLNILLIDDKNLKRELEDTKVERKNFKLKYSSLLTQYQNHNKEIIEFQKTLEIPLNKCAKIQKQKLQLIHQINDSFYFNLIDISKSTYSLHKEFKNLITLLLINPSHSPSDVFTFFKDKNGIKTIIEDTEITYKRLYTNEKEKFYQLKDIMKDTENLQKVYPFETVIEILKCNIDIIELQNIIDSKYKELKDKNDKNNFVFIEIKRIESHLKNKEMCIKMLYKKIKKISDLIESLNELQKQCKKENISKSITSNINLFKKIKETFMQIKDFEIYLNNTNYDGLSSLTIQSEYTQSDMGFVLGITSSHIKESQQQLIPTIQGSINANKSIHNEEVISQSENDNNNKEDKDKDINISICDEMVNTNDKAYQTIDFEYIHKINSKYNYYNSNNYNDLYETDIKNKESDILDKYAISQREENIKVKAYPKQKILILENNDENETCCSSSCSYSST